ncbi:MAG: hypothetical protein D6715_07625 [Calditrichaeota bacterium]|nr:MAG: hypothetical protein D6715_07625 [Calditrichota bacterium]
MPVQQIAFLVWLLFAIIIAAVFGIIGWRSRQKVDVSPARVNRFRILLLVILLVLSVIFWAYTLPKVPYPTEARQPDMVVFVTGKQFNFGIATHPMPTEKEWEEVVNFGEPVVLPRNKLIEFRVTSLDVNHGFSLYDPDHLLIGQVQAMPGYMNRLRYRFTKPGEYTVLCLEYCGNGHHRMRGAFTVQ